MDVNQMGENNLQQGYQYGQLQPMSEEGGKKKGRGGLIAVIVIAVVLLLTIAAVLVYRLVLNSPEARLTRGFANMAKELAEYENPVLKEIDYDTITENMKTEPYSLEMGLDMTIPGLGEFGTFGIDTTTHYDYPNEMVDGDMVISTFNIHLVEAAMTAADNRVYLSFPNLVEGTYFFNADTLGRDYHASVWAEKLDLDVQEDFSYELFPDGEEDVDEELTTVMKENLQYIRDTMTVEDAGDVLEIYRNGRLIKCKGVRVTLTKLALNRFFKELNEEMKGSEYEDVFSFMLADDVEICIYMDNKSRIVSIYTPEEIELQDAELETIDLDIAFSGEERVLDEVEGNIRFTAEDEELLLSMDSGIFMEEDGCESIVKLTFTDEEGVEALRIVYSDEWDYDEKEFACTVLLADEWDNFRIEAETSFSDIVTGESVTVKLGRLSVQEDGEELCKITGKIGMEPFTETITIPAEATDLFGMSETQVDAMLDEIYDSILGLFW